MAAASVRRGGFLEEAGDARPALWRPAPGMDGVHPAGLPAAVSLVRKAGRAASTLFAMAGVRPEHLDAVWVAGAAASIAFAHTLVSLGDWRLTVPYFLFTLVFYYGGNASILSSRVPARLIARLGERRAFRVYETVLGVMFLNQGLGVGCMAALPGWQIPVPREALVAAAAVLSGVGLVVKLWATLVVGTDTFYYFDMFVDRAVGTVSARGPYRFLKNPMYGMGQLQGYGYALFVGSLAGVAAAAVGHALIFGFYFLFEVPFMRRVYPAALAEGPGLEQPDRGRHVQEQSRSATSARGLP